MKLHWLTMRSGLILGMKVVLWGVEVDGEDEFEFDETMNAAWVILTPTQSATPKHRSP